MPLSLLVICAQSIYYDVPVKINLQIESELPLLYRTYVRIGTGTLSTIIHTVNIIKM